MARARDLTTRQAIRWILGLQVVLALLMMGGDLLARLPDLLTRTEAPPASQPVRPGDQTRRFAPRELPERRPGLPFAVPDAMPSRLSFEADGDTLRLVGQIEDGDGARFADHLATLADQPRRIALLSSGGSVADALQIGRAIRAAGLPTVVEDGAFCYSACPYVLAGGTDRTVHRGAKVGVHQHYFGENTYLPALVAVEDIQRGQAEVMGYLADMGVDALLMRHGLATPPEEIYVLLPEELTRYVLATEVVPAD